MNKDIRITCSIEYNTMVKARAEELGFNRVTYIRYLIARDIQGKKDEDSRQS